MSVENNKTACVDMVQSNYFPPTRPGVSGFSTNKTTINKSCHLCPRLLYDSESSRKQFLRILKWKEWNVIYSHLVWTLSLFVLRPIQNFVSTIILPLATLARQISWQWALLLNNRYLVKMKFYIQQNIQLPVSEVIGTLLRGFSRMWMV